MDTRSSSAASTLPPDIDAAARRLRRDLHLHPELAHEEHLSAARVADALESIGLRPVRVAGTGVYADIVGDPAGPIVCLRGDLDALPLTEDTALPFSSEVPGKMHACGHDIHTASAFAAAALLARDRPRGTVRVLFQPAEEASTGALACLRDGALDGVAAVLGGHVDLDYPVGQVALQAGPMCVGTEHIRIVVVGRGAHGARPQQGRDAIVAAAAIVTALQSIVAREIEPGKPAVVTIGTFVAGERHNILAGEARLEGTLRAADPGVFAQLRAAVDRVVTATAAAHGTTATVERDESTEPILNDPTLTAVVTRTLVDRLGSDGVRPLLRVNTGGEDFSFFLRDRPGVYVRWGAKGIAPSGPAHSARFCPDEGVIAVAGGALDAMARAVLDQIRSLDGAPKTS
jgi:amidohydrolase